MFSQFYTYKTTILSLKEYSKKHISGGDCVLTEVPVIYL